MSTKLPTIRRVAAACLALTLAACARAPTKEELGPRGDDWIEALTQSCTVGPDDAQLALAAGSPEQLKFVRRVNVLEAAMSGRPLHPGNDVTLLVDGPATHKTQLDAIAAARHHVHLNVYIMTDDEVGQAYLQKLQERARAGVKVRLLLDGIGGMNAGWRFREQLRAAGVEIHEYSPINPLKDPELWRASRRNHRKILVVDGRVAFTGGINISDEYTESGLSGSGGDPEHGWRDTHIRIAGPAVAEFQRLFMETWEKEHGAIPPDPAYYPTLAPAGGEFVRAVINRGNDLTGVFLRPMWELLRGVLGEEKKKSKSAIYGSYLVAISEAQRRIWITQAYFAPNDELIDVLKKAAARGVDVRLLVPGNSDVKLVLNASRYHYAGLLEGGVRIYEYEGPVLHAKTAVVDGVWATVGSSNLDFRSFIHNDEANAIIVGQHFGEQMERLFEDDLTRAREIDPEAWRRRSAGQKLAELMAVMWKYWI